MNRANRLGFGMLLSLVVLSLQPLGDITNFGIILLAVLFGLGLIAYEKKGDS